MPQRHLEEGTETAVHTHSMDIAPQSPVLRIVHYVHAFPMLIRCDKVVSVPLHAKDLHSTVFNERAQVHIALTKQKADTDRGVCRHLCRWVERARKG